MQQFDTGNLFGNVFCNMTAIDYNLQYVNCSSVVLDPSERCEIAWCMRLFDRNVRQVVFKMILMIGVWGIYFQIALRQILLHITDGKAALVQVMN